MRYAIKRIKPVKMSEEEVEKRELEEKRYCKEREER
jgi:hypothetical protein